MLSDTNLQSQLVKSGSEVMCYGHKMAMSPGSDLHELDITKFNVSTF